MTKTPRQPEYLRVGFAESAAPVGVDEDNLVIRGYVVAQKGEFKDKRGMFDESSLSRIVQLGQAAGDRGLRSRLSHPNESDDGLTKHLGRSKNFRLDGDKVRADLHLAKVSMDEPVGGGKPIGRYAMDLAKEDAGAIGSSLVLKSTKTARSGPDGERLPPHWMPEELFASDLVSDGDAVHGDLLSVSALDEFMEGSDRRVPTKLAIAGGQYLDQLFPESDRDVLHARITAWRDRYLSNRFGADSPTPDEESSDMDQETKEAIDALAKSTDAKLEKLSSMIEADIKSRQQQAGERERSAEIAALCKQAGYPDVEQLLAKDELSIEGARKVVFDWKCSQSTSLGNSTDGIGGESLSAIEKIRREWDTKKDELRKVGYKDREAWVRHECRDRDVEYESPAA